MERDWHFTVDGAVCGVRTAGVLIRDGKLLLQRERGGDEYALPGGHVRIGETLADGLVREYREETGAEISCIRLLWSEESFFTWKGKISHSLTFYHLIELREPSALPDSGRFIPHKDNGGVEIGWVPIGKLRELTVYPRFLASRIDHLEEAPGHFVSREE